MDLGPQFTAVAGPVRDLTSQRYYPDRTPHQEMMQTYRDARTSWEEGREKEPHMQMEDSDYRAHRTAPTLNNFMRRR